MSDLIPPHGRPTLVNGFWDEREASVLSDLKRDGLPVLTLTADQHRDCERIADGGLTPLEGFLKRAEVDALLSTQQLPSGAYFPIPILLPAPAELLGKGLHEVLLAAPGGELVGMLREAEVYAYDHHKLAKFIFGTTSDRHPGVARLKSGGDVFVGGRLLLKPCRLELSHFCLSPREVRTLITQKGFPSVVGFQTRNVPHLAHEYLQRLALESFAGLLLHPIIGWKKTGDFQPAVVMDAYTEMVNAVYPSGRVILSGLQASMFYAGPREAVLHAIIRQNFGCTHFIVGRDHAGAGDFYDKYEAHWFCEEVGDRLQIKIVRMHGPFFCRGCNQIATERTCGHDESQREEISGTQIRSFFLNGVAPPGHWMRPSIVEVIKRHHPVFVE